MVGGPQSGTGEPSDSSDKLLAATPGPGALAGLKVVVAGASGTSGQAVTAALTGAGATVLAVGSNRDRLTAAYGKNDAVASFECDLADRSAVEELAGSIAARHGGADGLVHLVGGWRGGKGLTGQSDEDWEFLHRQLITTLRNTTRAFYPQLEASGSGRVAIVSATATESPTASGANYAAAKAAAESWMLSVADGFRRSQSGRKEDPEPQRSAAVVLAVKALVDDDMRRADAGKPFPGFTDVADLGRAAAALFVLDAALLNGARIRLA
ncbi:SDR family NAD(P)-dependent oxidoreductase [Arthrobacter sp.]|uniref:SDR family NAD(P)-dependent oxidoreductase n=1 Tax=Arthrobacter sp. TaxID=1667 RepID=UPI00339532FE